MRSKLLFLMLTVGLLCFAGPAWAADSMVYNASFEIDEDPADGWPDLWGSWGSGPSWGGDSIAEFFMDDPVGARTGSAYWHGYAGANDYACTVPYADTIGGTRGGPLMEPQDTYFVGIWAKDLMPNGQPSARPPGLEVGYYNESGNRLPDPDGRFWIFAEEPFPADGQYHYFEGRTLPHPPGYPYLNVVPWVENWSGSGASEYAMDDMWMNSSPRSGLVHSFDPYDGQESVTPSTTILSWFREAKCPDRPIKCEVWWGKQDDPNFWYIPGEAKMIMDLTDANFVDLSTIPAPLGGPITLESDSVYYWKVKWEDPNACLWGNPDLTEGPTLSFDTINRPPVVDAGEHVDTWMASGDPAVTIGIDASYDDDGLPEGGVVTHEWNVVSGVVYSPHRFCQDPNVTIAATGDYILQLTVNDGAGHPEGKTGDDSILIRIFSNSDDRLRAHYPLDGNTTDIDEGHPATLVDNPAWGTGQVSGAVELDGTDDIGSDGLNDFVEIDDTGSDPNFQPDTWENSDLIDGFTVSAWMKLDADGWSTTWEAIVGKNNQAWELQRNGDNDNVGFVIQSGVGGATSSGATDVETGWHQIVGVYDRNTVKVYVDGLPSGSGNPNPLDLEANPQNTQDWQVPKAAGKIRIGAVSNVTADGDPQDLAFAGLIDQVRIFDAAVPWWAQYSNTPGIVEMYRADGGHDNCGGEYMPGDENQDCLITLADFALVARNWLECNNIADENCD